MVKTSSDLQRALPIHAYKQQIMRLFATHKVLLIIGETGSGKSTQVAQYLLDNPFLKLKKPIAVTQPRRVAAISLARRVAYERNAAIGSEIGYSVRFDSKTSPETRVKFVTDGMLIREALLDPSLSAYSCVIIDEAHERSVNTDILLGLLKENILKQGGKLKVIVMSATLEAEKFTSFFQGPEVLQVSGRLHNVEILHVPERETDYLDATIITIVQIHIDEQPGDILVFLTGQEEIEDAQCILERKRRLLPTDSEDILVLPLHAGLPQFRQMQVFDPAPPGFRKVILATNIAETSLTIPNVKYVVDSCRVKMRFYEPSSGIEVLKVVEVSKSAAMQRAGRAGREAPGKCFRMLTSEEYNQLPDHTTAEITRTNLTNVVLSLKIMHQNPLNFSYFESPQPKYIHKAVKDLQLLGALLKSGELTTTGLRMAELPLPPVLAKIVIASLDPVLQTTKDIVTIVALLSVENLCYNQSKSDTSAKVMFKSSEGDHITLLRIYKEWKGKKSKSWCKAHSVNGISLLKAKEIRRQLKTYLRKFDPVMQNSTSEAIIRTLARGLFLNSAMLSADGSHYRTLADDELVYIHPTSVLFRTAKKPVCVIFSEVVATSRKYMKEVSEVDLNYCRSLLAAQLS